MIKFTNILKESIDIDEIEDYFLLIGDTLGKTKKKVITGGDFTIYEFSWDLGFDISEYQSSDKIDRISSSLNLITELKAAQKRIGDYDIDFKITNQLSIRVTSISKSNGKYKFIIGQEWISILLSYLNIVKFFKDRGYSVLRIDTNEDEIHASNAINIKTNSDDATLSEFLDLFGKEYEESGIDSEIEFLGRHGVITIYPIGEKTYIEVLDK